MRVSEVYTGYQPATGLFLHLDPVPGGNANAYIYPTDPLTTSDLDGLISRSTLRIRLRALYRAKEKALGSIGRFTWRAGTKIEAIYAMYDVAVAATYSDYAISNRYEELNIKVMIEFKSALARLGPKLAKVGTDFLSFANKYKFADVLNKVLGEEYRYLLRGGN